MIQITKCPCGKIFAGCAEPHCYTDKEYQIKTRKYIKKGCTVEMVKSGESNFRFEQCTCLNMKPVKENKEELSIFNKEQLSLFNK